MTELHFLIHASDGGYFIFTPTTAETHNLTLPYAQGLAQTWIESVKDHMEACTSAAALTPALLATLFELAVKKSMGIGFIVKVEVCADCCGREPKEPKTAHASTSHLN